MSSQDSAYHSQSQGASTPNSEMPDSGINDGSLDDSVKMNSSTLNGYNSIPNHKIISSGQIISKMDNSVKISEHKHSNSSHHNSDHIKKKEGELNKHSSSSLKHKDEHSKISKSSNSISSKEHGDKKHEHSKGDSDKLKKEKNSSEKSHHDSSKKVDKHHEDKHREKPKDGHSEHKHKEHKSKDGEHKSKERDKLKEHDKSKHDSSSKDKLKKLDGHKEKHGEKPKEKSDKDKSDKPKDKSDRPKEKSDKPKEKIDKLKEKSDKPKEKSSIDKHKEKSEHKERSDDKHKEKSEHKHKEGDKSKEKVEKHKEKSDKHKDKNDRPKDKTERPKEKSDKPKEKSDKPKEKSDKPKEKLDKLKDKSVEKSKDKSINIKRESSPEKKSSPIKDHSKKESPPKPKAMSITVETETIDTSQVKMEFDSPLPSPQKSIKEDYFSEDDLPLSSRKPIKGEPVALKREIEESDDEPLSARISKTKKIKTEPSSANKRKTPESDYDDDDYGGDDYADDDYDSDYKKPSKKKVKKDVKPKKTPAKTKKKEEPSTPTSSPTKSPTKKGRGKKAEEEQEVWKWWEEEKHEDGVKWRKLEHNGPVFAPAYERVPKNVKFYYDGKHMVLSEVAEEVAGFYGRMLDHDYTTKESFNKNFFKDWRKVMTPEERELIKDLTKCNFNDFNNYYKMKSEERKAMTKEEKQEIKKQNEALVQQYGFCVIDGHRQKIGNFKIEPPGLFRGRGEHPKMGMLKRRVEPEDISINIGKEAKIPEAPAGHKWKDVRHDNTVTWLCSWTENILGSTKYIMLNPSSKLKGEKDWQKYETARKLKNYADKIRKTYSDDFKSKEMKIRQRAVALYFIDKLALRAGNEKDEDTADTVGCCSLRVEHITMDEEKDGQQYVVSFDFLGKDSIRYVNSVAVEKRAYKNLKLFMENKQPADDLFDRLNTSILNKYLNELMEGLTAKVFRTYNASKTLQEQLDLLTKEEMSVPEKLLAYNRANRAVAILCNHQRAVPKTFDKSMENLKTKIDDKIQQIRTCKKELKQLKSDAKNSGSAKDKVLAEKKKKRLAQLEDQLKKLEVQATDKEENKQIALGTSKLNYLDPRISVAWCKKWDVPIEKIYNRTQRDKFRWAIEMAGPDFKF